MGCSRLRYVSVDALNLVDGVRCGTGSMGREQAQVMLLELLGLQLQPLSLEVVEVVLDRCIGEVHILTLQLIFWRVEPVKLLHHSGVESAWVDEMVLSHVAGMCKAGILTELGRCLCCCY